MINRIVLIVTLLACAGTVLADVTVTVDPAIQNQTILGWGASSWAPPWTSQLLCDAIIKEAVNELGLTRLRLELPSGNRSDEIAWEWENDDWEPLNINWSAFNTSAADKRILQMVLPFKLAVEANVEPFNLYVSPSFFDGGSSGSAPTWLLRNPGEYAEFALAYLLNLKNIHGIDADFYCILNEAGNNNPFNAWVVDEMIKTLGLRLQAVGLSTKIQFPESINARVAWDNYIRNVKSDEEMWQYVGCLSYHLYGANDPYRSYIRDFGMSKSLPTAQTEFMNLNMNHLYDDLTLGGVSYWETYGLGQCFQWNPNNTSFSRIRQYWNFRQVMHYVRPGAVRIEAISSDSNLRTLAFEHNDTITVVLINGSGFRTTHINNLPTGTYGLCQSVGGGVYQELGLQATAASQLGRSTGTLTVNVPSNAVITIYPHPGTNQPPIVTDFKASPDYLNQSAGSRFRPSTTNLSTSATDPELDPISYAWSVTSRPAGANASLITPNSATTSVTGLTVAGQYVFTVAVSDGMNTVTRDVVLNVYPDNQPPVPLDVHNRLPVMVTLPASSTELRGGAIDLENDPLSYRWILISQPRGASASLVSPTNTKCKVTNMTVAGDYIFNLEVSDPTHTVSENLTVTVYPQNPSAPVITNAGASPDNITLPADNTLLSAITSDPDGDPISHWWSVKSKPAGTSPVFFAQSSPDTDVTGLTVAGIYVFTLTLVDRTKFTTQDVAVTVLGPGTAGPFGWWKFDEGSGVTAADSSGNGNDGAIFGPAWTTGKVGQALNFDGVDDYVRIPTNPSLDDLTAITMAAWIYPRVDSHWHVLDKGDGDKRIYAEGMNLTLVGRVRYTGNHAYAESVSNTLILNTWQHLVMTWSAADNITRLYHNGVEVSYAKKEVGTGSILDDTTHPFLIGTRGNLSPETFFNGLIDEVRLYGRDLSAQEVWGLYNYVSSYRVGDLN